jgi:hypothetical protein
LFLRLLSGGYRCEWRGNDFGLNKGAADLKEKQRLVVFARPENPAPEAGGTSGAARRNQFAEWVATHPTPFGKVNYSN